MKGKNKTQIASPIAFRPGEGVVLNIVRMPGENGQLQTFQMNLHDAAVPDRRYTSDFCSVVDCVEELDHVKILFGARKPVAQGLMSTPQTFSSNWYQAGNGQTMTGPYIAKSIE